MLQDRLERLKEAIGEEKGRRDEILDAISSIKKDLKQALYDEEVIKEGIFIANEVAKKTQKKLEYCLSELVTLALSVVFPDKGYSFQIIFDKKRDKTEMKFYFKDKDGELFDPLDDSGGGVLDIAAFALRPSLYAIMSEKPDNVFILDEPFKHLRGSAQQKRASKMVKMLSRKLGIQIIMVGDVGFSVAADKVFEAEQINKCESVIKEVTP